MSDALATHRGACHCGAVAVTLTLGSDFAGIVPRACQCGFCTSRGSLGLSDPNGFAEIALAGEGAARRYRFGHGTADFLICARCGTFAAAVTGEGDSLRCVLNARGLGLAAFLDRPAAAAEFGAETPAERDARRARNWTPARLLLAG